MLTLGVFSVLLHITVVLLTRRLERRSKV
jgi:hypothetical protein